MDYSVDALTETLTSKLFEIQEVMEKQPAPASRRAAETLAGLQEMWAEAVAAHPDPVAALRQEATATLPLGNPFRPQPGVDVPLPNLLMMVRLGRGEDTGGFWLG